MAVILALALCQVVKLKKIKIWLPQKLGPKESLPTSTTKRRKQCE